MNERPAPLTGIEKLAIAGLIVAAVAHVALAGIADIIVDEAYALAIAPKFQLSFFDHPPLAFWLAGTMLAIAGPDAPAIVLRLPFVVLSFGSLYLLYQLTARNFGRPAGLWAALLWLLVPHFFFASGAWILPDGPLLFFLLLTAITLDKVLFRSEETTPWRGWLLAGVWLGFAMLSKYHAVLFPLGVLLFLAASPTYRHWLAKPQPYVAGLIALLVFSPVIIWNATHDWASFAFQFGRANPAQGMPLVKLLGSFLGQAAYMSPWLMVLAVLAAFRARNSAKPLAGLLIAVASVPIVLFTLVSIWGTHNLPHWQMVGWLFLFPLLGYWLMPTGGERTRLAGALLALGGLLLAVAVGFWSSLIYEIPVQLPERAARDGVKEVASWRRLQPVLADAGVALQDNEFLADPGWIGAAHAAEAFPGTQDVLVLGSDKRGFAYVTDPDSYLGRDALLIKWSESADTVLAIAQRYFSEAEIIATLPFPAAPSAGRQVVIIRARDYQPPE